MSNHPLTFGIQTMLGTSWPNLVQRWKEYEAAGWDSLWLPDHLSPPSGEPGPFFEAWMALAALAPLTSTANIGTLVSSNTFRHPSVLAKQAVTVDHLSGGRLILGFGAGWFDLEHEQFGIELPPIGERVSRYAEALDLLDTFLRNDLTTFDGKWYTLRDAPNRPKPVHAPRMPIIVGAHGPRTIGIAARHADIWNTRGPVDEVQERQRTMDDACGKIGRDPDSVIRSLLYIPTRTPDRPWDSLEAFTDYVGKFREIGITDFLFDEPPAANRGILERVAGELLPTLRKS